MNGHVVRLSVTGLGEVPAREAEFRPITEPWGEYELLDGGKVRVRATALKIYRVLDDDGKPRVLPDGQPWWS
jgi:hypothetical protein